MAGKATRASFGEALVEIGGEFKNVVALDADLSKSTKSDGFAKKYPERFFQMGISEANMIGVAAGMSFAGKIPFLCSFGCFLTGRFDTIRVSVGYSQANVRLVGTHAGIGIGEDGCSQMALEDLSCMRTLPLMTVLQPADDVETKQMMRALVTHVGPVYLRLTRQNLEAVSPAGYQFKLGKGVVLKDGSDATIFATGGTVYNALKAAESFQAQGKSVGVVNIHTIKPIDSELIASLARKSKVVFTAEDHSVIGGLGSAVAEVLATNGIGTRLVRLGVQDVYGESGTPEQMYQFHKLDTPGLVEQIKPYFA